MSNAVIPFDFSAPAPQRERRVSSINAEQIINRAGFPVISIKGKVFAIVKDNERKVLTRMIDDEPVAIPALSLTVIRANAKARVFYGKGYVEGESDGTKPLCFSHDGVAPDATVEEPQHSKCQLCPHAQWGTKVSQDGLGKGTACTVNTRLAVADPKAPETVYLLRVPAGSRTNFSDAVKIADSHGKDYNEVIMRIGFDQEAPSPKLTFRPTGLLSDEAFAKIEALYDDQTVRDIVGVPTVRVAQEVAQVQPKLAAPAKPAPLVVSEDELDDALGAAVAAVAPTPAPAAAPARRAPAKPVAARTPAPVEAPAPAPAKTASADAEGLLGELTSLLGASDD